MLKAQRQNFNVVKANLGVRSAQFAFNLVKNVVKVSVRC